MAVPEGCFTALWQSMVRPNRLKCLTDFGAIVSNALGKSMTVSVRT